MAVLAAFLMPHPPLLVPEVGKGQEEGASATRSGCRRAAAGIAALRPETIVLFSPHSIAYADYIHIHHGEGAVGSLSQFGAHRRFEVEYDSALAAEACRLCDAAGLPAGTLGGTQPELDHGVLVPLHFLREAGVQAKLVRVSLSGLSREEHYRLGILLARAAEKLDRRVVALASGDLSHKLAADGPYGFAPEGPALDKAITDSCASGDFGALFTLPDDLCQKGGECGLLSLVMAAGMLDSRAVDAALLSYEGPFGVGYAVASFHPANPDPARAFLERRMAGLEQQAAERRARESPHVRLARAALEGYLRTGSVPALPADLPGELTGRRAGVFVSLKKRGQLRGCIGTTEPTTGSVAAEIVQNALSAGLRDPRFPQVETDELDELSYSVDVLSPSEPAERSNLDPKRYGVIVSYGGRRGLLLPGLDGVNTVEEQLDIACRKAGIGPCVPCKLERFEVVRYH